jgi:hypothetical protein
MNVTSLMYEAFRDYFAIGVRNVTDMSRLQSLNWLTVLPGDIPICSRDKYEVTTVC